MNIRINQDISMETEIPFQSVQEFSMVWEINEHVEVKMRGIIKNDDGIQFPYHNYSGNEIRILLEDSLTNEGKKVLFCGLAETVDFKYGHGIMYSEIKARSASIRLDNEKLCCSFQDTSQTYAEIVKEIAEAGNGNIICTTGKRE